MSRLDGALCLGKLQLVTAVDFSIDLFSKIDTSDILFINK